MDSGHLTLAKALASFALIGSGAGLAKLLSPTSKTIEIIQNQHRETARRRNTILRKHGDTDLYLEYSHLDDEQRPYIYDPLTEKEADYVYYLANANGKIIRLSPKPLPANHNVYLGWIPNQFNHTDLKATFYGYCHPKGGECDHLPPGWTRKPQDV